MHELQTVFQLLDWGDEIALRVRPDAGIVRLSGAAGVAADADLAVRAARALQVHAGTGLGADIAVEKRIPAGGGLGGGSSDAATVLIALNALWGSGLTLEQLARIGLTLGADVPVFVHGHSAWAEGVGETLTPVQLPERWFIVVDPGVSVATGPVFQAPELTRDSPRTTIPRFLAGDSTRNDLEPVVRARHGAVAQALDWLGSRACARLTGSGACVFAPMDSQQAAQRIAGEVPATMSAVVVRGVNRSPLHTTLGRWRGS